MMPRSPKRIQHRRPACLPSGAKAVGRGSRWGNPFVVSKVRYDLSSGANFESGALSGALAGPAVKSWGGSQQSLALTKATEAVAREAAVAMFRIYATNFARFDPEGFSAWLDPLRGHDIACACDLLGPCHGDVLLELVSAMEANDA